MPIESAGGVATNVHVKVYTPEDDMRKEVTSLYNRCGNDVAKMLEVIGTTLHETAGRNDVKVYTDPDGALVSVTQAPQYGLRHRRQNAFLHSLDVIVDRTRRELETHKERLNRDLPFHYQTQEEFKKSVYDAITDAPDQHHVSPSINRYAFSPTGVATRELRGLPDGHKPRCYPKTEHDEALESLPTSRFNGNYTLRRYGGHFPKHANYSFYRKYGLKGKGAVTSEKHNFPMGAPPIV